MTIWYLYKFTSLTGDVVVEFPRGFYELDIQQALAPKSIVIPGSHYSYNTLGGSPAVKRNGVATIRFEVNGHNPHEINTVINPMVAQLYSIGFGKLWATGEYETGSDVVEVVERWCYAQMPNMPSINQNTQNRTHIPVITTFDMYSDFYGDEQVEEIIAVNSSPKLFTINNPGLFNTDQVEFRFRSNGVSGFSFPRLENLSNGYVFASLRAAVGANDEWKVDGKDLSVQYSADNGQTYADDFAMLINGQNQRSYMFLQVGDNDFEATGGTNYSLEIRFWPSWPYG